MKTNYQYEQLIREKLEQLPSPKVNDLWSKMESVLDVEMPVEKSKRPSPVFLLTSSGITMFIAAAIFTVFIINRSISTSPKNIIATEEQAISKVQSVQNNNSNTNNNTANSNNSTLLINNGNDVTAIDQNASTPFVPVSTNKFSSNKTDYNYTQQNNTVKVLPSDYDNINEPAPHQNALESLQGRDWNNLVSFTIDKKAVATPFMSMQAKNFSKNSVMNKIVAGVSFNYNVPFGNQQKTSFNYNNKNTALYDYLPSVFVQYHFSKKFYIEAEAQYVTPQYTPNAVLYNRVDMLNADEKNIETVKVNKLYYMNVPVAVHFTPTPHLTIGAGVQISQLKQMILTDEQYYSFKSRGQWNTSLTSTETDAKSIPTATEKSNMTTAVDSAAAGFKRTDMRLNLEAGYNVGRFNIGVRYTEGLSNYSDNKVSPNALPSGKNQSLQLFVKVNLFDKRKF